MKAYNWFLYFILLVLCTIAIITIVIIRDDGVLCQMRPLEYGVAKISEQSKDNLLCSCSFQNPRYAPFIVSQNGTKQLITLSKNNQMYKGINFSGYNKP